LAVDHLAAVFVVELDDDCVLAADDDDEDFVAVDELDVAVVVESVLALLWLNQ
jgi:hypothetical protein